MSTPARSRFRHPHGTEPNAIRVEVSSTQGFLPVDAAGLARLARLILRSEGIERGEVSIALVDNSTIHRINRQHLGHDWATDVISFNLSGNSAEGLSGELVVSAEMAAASAAELGEQAEAELALYVAHGVLHLCGYDDATESGSDMMHSLERDYLNSHGGFRSIPRVQAPQGEASVRELAS